MRNEYGKHIITTEYVPGLNRKEKTKWQEKAKSKLF